MKVLHSPNDYSNIQDFLIVNTPTSFAHKPVQVIEVAEVLLEGTAQAQGKLIRKYSFPEA